MDSRPGKGFGPSGAIGPLPNYMGPSSLKASSVENRKVEKLNPAPNPLRQGEGHRWKCHARAQESSVTISISTRSQGEKRAAEVSNASPVPLKKPRKPRIVDKLNDSDDQSELVVAASQPHQKI